MTVTLRPNQIAAADAVEAAFARGITRPLVDSCVGSGKSLTMAEIARRRWQHGERTVICAHTRELVEQNAAACRALGLQVGVNAAALGERTWRAPVISAAIQSVYSSGRSFGPIANMLVDECFPSCTLIATPSGARPIEQIQPGDVVTHALGVGAVEAVSKRETMTLTEIEIENGTVVRCTPAHPLFTLQGWQSAGRLVAGQSLVLAEGVQALFDRIHTTATERTDCERVSVEQAELLLDFLLKEARQLHARPAGSRENDRNDTPDRSSAEDPRWQRQGYECGASSPDPCVRFGMGSGTSRFYANASRVGLSDKLQNRHRQSPVEISNRGRRSVAQRETSDYRCKERQTFAFARVVRVETVKLASPVAVFNLQVAGHPSYFADGVLAHNCHLIPHSEAGMYRQLYRDLGEPRQPGFSGTTFRLQGGSLVEGEAAPFQAVVYQYGILDGIRDGYLVPAFSGAADDKIDASKLRKKQGEYSGDSQDAQMLALMDNHIAQMVSHGRDRRAWLVFEATTKAAKAMCARMNEWNIPTGLVLGTTPAGERAQAIAAFRQGRLKALVNVAALTTGFDVQEVDMLVMRRKTMSVGLYIQMTGRLLRTIGGTIEKSIAAGKADGLVLDFAGNIDQHGPLDFIRPKETKSKLVSCDECGKRNAAAAMRCWSCDEPMTKLCPACLVLIQKGLLDCPHCAHDMRAGERAENAGPKLLQTPSGAALIASFRPMQERLGGWIPIRRAFEQDGAHFVDDANGVRWPLIGALAQHAIDARWVRGEDGVVEALLKPNGAARSNAIQIAANGSQITVPMPGAAAQ